MTIKVKEFIGDIMEQLISLLFKEDREELMNKIAAQFQIKIKDLNQKKQPMHIEMVRDNFNHILSALKVYEQKQQVLEENIKSLQVLNAEMEKEKQ